jgi:hypothetical protein
MASPAFNKLLKVVSGIGDPPWNIHAGRRTMKSRMMYRERGGCLPRRASREAALKMLSDCRSRGWYLK